MMKWLAQDFFGKDALVKDKAFQLIVLGVWLFYLGFFLGTVITIMIYAGY